MKCPKCDYLGFESTDRCRNCGYDFSLSPIEGAAADVVFRLASDQPADSWTDAMDRGLGSTPSPDPVGAGAHSRDGVPRSVSPVAPAAHLPVPDLELHPAVPPPAFRGEPSLPLFNHGITDDDRPLVTLPAAPRAPLAVRRTPDTPRLRSATPRTVERPLPSGEPTLVFGDAPATPVSSPVVTRPAKAALSTPAADVVSGAGPRLIAAVVDHAILGGIDLIVIYFTLRLAALQMDEWRLLPAVPLVAFLALMKVAYFTAFTALGGQTIGKMAMSIRVVAEPDTVLDPMTSARRALAGAVSVLTLGAAFVPALVSADRRALHDRLAHTRVVALRQS